MDQYTLEILKSLLQKAVRRANVDLVEKVITYLISVNQFKWVKDRMAVIAYEECWTFGPNLHSDRDKLKVIEQYKTLAATVKNKNAAGLATLASHYHEGDKSTLMGYNYQKDAIRSISNAIENPSDFWKWVRGQPSTYPRYRGRIESAKKAITKAKFKTDKAMMYAAAYFSAKDEVPKTTPAQPQNSPNFPYWVAIDKHTNMGRVAFLDAYQMVDLLLVDAQTITFYLEGSKCNQIANSPYWDLAKQWNFDRMNDLTPQMIHAKWAEFKPVFIKLTKSRADEVREIIESPISNSGNTDQLSLL